MPVCRDRLARGGRWPDTRLHEVGLWPGCLSLQTLYFTPQYFNSSWIFSYFLASMLLQIDFYCYHLYAIPEPGDSIQWKRTAGTDRFWSSPTSYAQILAADSWIPCYLMKGIQPQTCPKLIMINENSSPSWFLKFLFGAWTGFTTGLT